MREMLEEKKNQISQSKKKEKTKLDNSGNLSP